MEAELKLTFSHDDIVSMIKERCDQIATPGPGYFDIAKSSYSYSDTWIATFVAGSPVVSTEEAEDHVDVVDERVQPF